MHLSLFTSFAFLGRSLSTLPSTKATTRKPSVPVVPHAFFRPVSSTVKPKSVPSTKSKESLKRATKDAGGAKELTPAVPSEGKGKRKALVLSSESEDSDVEVISVASAGRVTKGKEVEREILVGGLEVEEKRLEVVEMESEIVELEGGEGTYEDGLNEDEREGESDGEWGHDEIVGSDVEMELHGEDDETYGDDFDRAEDTDIATIVARQGQNDDDAEMARQIEEDEREQDALVQGSSKDLAASTAIGRQSGASCPVCSALLPMDKSEAATHVNRCLDGGASLTNFLPPRSSLFSKSLSKSASAKSNPFFAKASVKPQPITPSAPNAFSALMSKNQDSKAWETSEAADKKKGRLPKGEIRIVPFYKWVGGSGNGIGMQITVDAFKYGKIAGCKAYFLSHAHSDHYQNLSASWSGGPVYCSTVTAKLIKLKLNVKDKYLIPLEMNKTHLIEGVNVTLIDANHCPGSTIFLFEGPQSDPKSSLPPSNRIYRYLHCGDFRASPAHIAHPALRGKKLDICYLDTTYLDPKYCFPAQELVINACVDLVKAKVVDGDDEAISQIGGAGMEGESRQMKGWLTKGKKEEVDEEDMVSGGGAKGKSKEVMKPDRWLVVVGTYSVGKERIVKNIAVSLKTKIYANPTKMKLLRAQDDALLDSLLTTDPLLAQVHVVFLSSITNEHLAPYLAQYRHLPNGFTKLIGLRPTGWTYRPEKDGAGSTISAVLSRESMRIQNPAGMIPQRDSKPGCLAFGVPYSEHSSFFELTCFALTLDCVKFIPTVNVGKKASRDKMTAWFDRWSVEKRRRKLAGIPPPHPRAATYW